jgi:DNA adenine methylase
MFKVHTPPIKSQGIKTKLVPWIAEYIPHDFSGRWIEPFMGTGVVGFNLAPKRAILCDINPHLVNFYNALQDDVISPEIAREFLEREGQLLRDKGEAHYYYLRDRFNAEGNPLDFLFVNRAGFNGMIRFNRKGGFNIPFCRKPNRFAQAYITKITNQTLWVYRTIKAKEFSFLCQDFAFTIAMARAGDLIYCDPPYIDRHVDYFGGWDEASERSIAALLSGSSAKFILSSWHHNDYRKNEYMDTLWSKFVISTKNHFYHVGAKETNRNPVVEALVMNFDLRGSCNVNGRSENAQRQLELLSG